MDLQTIEMERPKARRAFLDYRKAVRERHNAEDEEIMRGYRELAAGRTLLHLSQTMSAGGVSEISWRQRANDPETLRVSVLPRLAVCRAHVRTAFTDGIRQDGSLEIRSKEAVSERNRFDRVRFGERTFPTHDLYEESWQRDHRQHFRAMVPLIPPALRPKAGLHNFHILWEAEWKIHRPPAPRDPALLRHIGGDLYAVVAIWDLTDLERAVLGARS